MDNIFLVSPLDARRLFKEADTNYRALKPKSAELRESFLRSKLAESTTGSPRYAALRTLIQHETQREIARFLRRLEGTPQRRSVTTVQEIDSTGKTISFSTRDDIEHALSRCLESRFRVTDHSPLMQPYLRNLLGTGSLTPLGQRILAGDSTVDLPYTSEYTRWLLQGMARPYPPLPQICTSISVTDFQTYWRRAPEKTSSSISGLHFGHYKAASFSPALSEFHAFMTEVLFRTGYPLKRWQNGLQVILEKKPGVVLVSKLRAILLMEADFNFGNKLYVGSRMVHNARLEIPSELYGGVRGRRVEFMALSRRLLADILRQKRRAGAVASVDAQSCYDRITHSTASLCCQRWGVPNRIMETMLSTIQGMRFFLRTGYGDSHRFYGGGSHLFQGICQGNGAGPAVWLAISAVLILLLREKAHGSPIRGAFSPVCLVILAFLFVDDTDLCAVGHPTDFQHEDLLRRLQSTISLWQGLLQATGGSLSAEKCSWSLAAFRWKSGKWYYHTEESFPATMFVTDDSQVEIPILRIDPTVSTTIVGVDQALDGSMTGQLTSLLSKVDRWSTSLCQGTIPRHIAWAAIRSKIWPCLRFPLSSSTLTRQQGRTLMGRLYKHLLPRLGTNRSIAAAVRYGPLSVAGLDLPDPYIYQGSMQVALFHQLYGTDTREGHLLRISLEHLQLEVGCGSPVLLTDYSKYGFLATHSWLRCLWEFVSQYSIRLEADYPIPPLCREHDQYIMDTLVINPQLSKADLISANRCRLHLRLLVFSDLATGGGDMVRDSMFHVRQDNFQPSDLEWQEERPSSHDVALWKKCLTSTLAQSPLHLGPWVAEPHYRQQWWYDGESDQLVKRFENQCWWVYSRSVSRQTRSLSHFGPRYRLSGIRSSSDRPVHWCRTTVRTHRDGRVSHEGFATSRAHMMGSLLDCPVLRLDPGRQFGQALPRHTLHFPDNGQHVAQAIINGTAHGASDGSYMPSRSKSHGTAAWILEDSCTPGLDICYGTSRTTNWHPSDVNAYRSELQGIYMALLMLQSISNIHKITSGSIILYCDNEKAVHLASQTTLPLPSGLAHLDLLRSIRFLRSNLPFSTRIVHIRGHQDRLCPSWSLTRPSQLNIACDILAKEFLCSLLRTPHTSTHRQSLVGEGPRCFLNDRKLVGNIQQGVAEYCSRFHTMEYLVNKGTLTWPSSQDVNWDAIGGHLCHQSVPYRLWATKHSFKFSATGRNMKRWGMRSEDSCPCCGQADESETHLYECTSPAMLEARCQAITQFQIWMRSANTHPDIVQCFIQALSLSSSFQSWATPAILSAASNQDVLGSWNTWVGRVSREWESIQERHYICIGSQRLASLWSMGMVEHILAIGHRLWKTRNDALHNPQFAGLTSHEVSSLNTALTEEFSLGLMDLHQSDHHLITRRTLPTLLGLPITHRRLWLESIQLARQQGRARTLAEDNSMAGIMRRWLGCS